MDVVALGMNMTGSEAEVPLMTQEKKIPLLQDNAQIRAMQIYLINKDDLLLVDRAGKKWRQEHTSSGGFDLRTAEDRDTLTQWVRSIP